MQEDNYNLSFQGFFNSSHYIYGYELKEELHGHNYVITYKLKTPATFLNEKIKEKLALICQQIDQKVIIPLNSPTVLTLISLDEVRINLQDGTHYSFPRSCCYLMNEVNSTAECIARHFFDETQSELEADWVAVKVVVAEIYEQQEAIYKVQSNRLPAV